MRLIDGNGSYTLNEINGTGHSLAFGGNFIDVYDSDGKHICQFWAGDAPAIDAAEVVRCKGCKYYETGVEYYTGGPDVGTKDICRLLHRQMLDDDFCSYGERRNYAEE